MARGMSPAMRHVVLLLIAACSAAPHHPGASEAGFDAGEAVVASVNSPADVARLCDRTKATLAQLRDAATRTSSDAETLAAVRRLDRAALVALGTVDVPAEVHPDAKVRDAAHACEASLDTLVTDTLTSPLVAKLDKIRDPYAESIVASAKLAGYGLSADAARELKQLQEREAKLTADMSETLGTPPAPLLVDPSRLAGLPDSFLATHPTKDGKVSLDPNADEMMINQSAQDRTLPVELQRAGRAAFAANVPRIPELLAVRHRIAELLGCPSYVECQARTRMVGTPTRTAEFLTGMTKMIDDVTPQYRAAIGLKPDERVAETDLRSIEVKARRRLGQTDPDPWTAYLETEPTLDRMLAEVGAGVGLEFVRTKVPTWSPDVVVYDVNRGGKRVGRFFFDLYLRPGKVPFTGESIPFAPHTAGDDSPVSVVISIGVFPATPSVLKPAPYVKLLMHELGHSIDFLFEKQSAFASSEMDWYDVPSQLFEAWADQPGFLEAVGRKDGKPLPVEGAEALRNELAWQRFKFTRSVTAFGLMDLEFHGPHVPADASATCSDAWERVIPIHVDRGSHPEVELFMPIIVYAGNGHALPWGLAISSDLAGEFKQGLKDPVTWKRFIDEVLASTGPANPRIERFLGRPWNLERLRARILPPLGL